MIEHLMLLSKYTCMYCTLYSFEAARRSASAFARHCAPKLFEWPHAALGRRDSRLREGAHAATTRDARALFRLVSSRVCTV
jgi:hypothetical protein